jgi:sialate O-acetylesterase
MIQLAALFQDHAILQRDQPIAVWGWGPPRCRVLVTLGPHVGHGMTTARGRFEVWLPPLPERERFTLTVTVPARPEIPPATARDLLAGEVWLASGQSNMEWTLAQCDEFGKDAIASSDDPGLRFFIVEKSASLGPQDDVEGTWKLSSPETAPIFSAVACHFARKLRGELGVPVGIIVSAWGGTPIEAWLSRQAHARSSHLAVTTANYHLFSHSDERWARFDPSSEDGVAIALPPDPGPSQRQSSGLPQPRRTALGQRCRFHPPGNNMDMRFRECSGSAERS